MSTSDATEEKSSPKTQEPDSSQQSDTSKSTVASKSDEASKSAGASTGDDVEEDETSKPASSEPSGESMQAGAAESSSSASSKPDGEAAKLDSGDDAKPPSGDDKEDDKETGLDVFDDLVKKSKPSLVSRTGSAPPPPPPSKVTRPPASVPPPASKAARPPAPPKPSSTPVPPPPPSKSAPPPAPSARAATPVPPPAGSAPPPTPLPLDPVADDETTPNRASAPQELDDPAQDRPRSSRPPSRPSYPSSHKNVLAKLGKRSDSDPPSLAEASGGGLRHSSPPVRRPSAPNLSVPVPPSVARRSSSSLDEDAAGPAFSRPASIPPPPRPPMPPPGSRRPSETPPAVAVSRPPSGASLGSGRGLQLLLAAAVILIVGGGAGFALMPSSGTLVVSASGPHGRVLPSVQIFVDEIKRCDQSPCRIDGLDDGVHIVAAKAPGYDTMAGKAVKIQSGDEVPFDLELQPSEPAPSEEKAAQAKQKDSEAKASDDSEQAAKEDDETPSTSIEDLEPVDRGQQTPAAPAPAVAANQALAQKLAGVAPSPPAPAPPAPPSGAQAKLNINSIPATRVVVDGRPLGLTPQMGLAVPPGTHTVVFIHPEHGRKVRQITVQPGQTLTAAVRFP